MMMMKLSKVEESGKSSRNEEDSSSSGRLLRDIEEISKALYLQKKNPPMTLISPSDDYRSKSAGESKPNNNNVDEDSSLQKGKKSSSIWSWKPLKALTHIRSHRFNCCFFLRVHSIKGLPSNFNDLGLYVHWKRKDQVLQTCPARVSEGVAEFEETLMHRCSIYATKNGGSQDSTKYEPKLFLLYASVVGSPALDIGKHWLDLTRLLPHTFEENKRRSSSGKWTTSFNLTGKAKGAILNVSFGFSSSGVDGSFQSRTSFVKVPDLLKGSEPSSMEEDQVGDFCRTSGSSMLQRFVSIPSNSNHVSSQFNARSLDIQVVNDVFPKRGSELTRSITFLYNNKLDKEHLGDLEEEEDFNFYYEHLGPHKSQAGSSSESGCENSGNESNDTTEFTVIEQGIEYPSNDRSEIETIDVAEGDEEEEMESNSKGNLRKDDDEVDGENYLCSQEPTIEVVEWVESSSLDDEKGFLEQEENFKTELSKGGGKMKKSLSFDDVTTESVTNEFLNLLSFEQSQLDIGCSSSEPESPRERLLREFEKDAIASGKNPFFDFDAAEHAGAASGDCTPDYDLSLFIQAAKKDDDGDEDDDDDDDDDDWVRQSLRSRRRDAKMLENLETEALMQQWGLNETAFESSPSGGFGSPVYIYPCEELPPQLLPILGEGLDAVIKTKGGGFLRSMSPSLFRNAKNGERLIMQVSRTIVLPAVMGSSGMEILQCWGLVGMEKMRMQANELLMPLDDITGKTMQQVAWEALSEESKELQSWHFLQNISEIGENSSGFKRKVEQGASGESWDDDSGCVFLQDLAPLAMDKIAALSIEGLRIQSGLVDEEAPSRIRLMSSSSLTTKSINFSGGGKSFSFEGSVDIDELITLSISLDDWMKLDSEIIDNVGGGENNDQKISMILAAHLRSREDKMEKPFGMRCGGSLGDNLTIALNVQLRDPFRDYESVGNSMLALIQLERIFVPQKSDTHSSSSRVSERRNYNGEEEECIPRFKIIQVDLAGLNAKPGKRTHDQQQSGSRWLQSSGLGKIRKNILLNNSSSSSSAIVRRSSLQMMRKARAEDTLWSVSSHVHCEGDKWKELSILNLHARNPDIVFPDETIKIC